MDASFFQAPVAVPKNSGFDKSFQNLYTAKVGTLVPALCDEIMPGSIINLDMAASVSLPPLASDTFMRCSMKVEAFYVPMRLCYGGFEHWFVQDEFEALNGPGSFATVRNQHLPCFSFGGFTDVDPALTWDMSEVFGAGTLADYLGFKAGSMKAVRLDTPTVQAKRFSLMPYIAYHKIWSDWYRSTLVQKDCFAPLSGIDWSSAEFSLSAAPFSSDSQPVMYQGLNDYDADFSNGVLKFSSLANTPFELADGVNIFQLRQRNFGFDFFTCAQPSPQNGPVARVSTAVSGDPANSFTISQLRSMNSLQQWRERNSLTGDRYVDRLYGQYGCRPSDGIAQRVLCLASTEFEVYNKGIYNSNNSGSTAGAQGTQNPFGASLASRGGSAYGSTDGAVNLCKGFKASEPGYLFVITSLVPRVTYATGLDFKLTRYTVDGSIGEMANPILQNIGPEPIYTNELTEAVFDQSRIFGYTDRYGRFKNKFDELHGLVREGESLESFALQRYLDPSNINLQLSSEFLEIPTDYMDNVTAVSGDISQYGCWVDSYFQYRVSMPLAKYSLPTLQDPAYEHGKTITVRRGGFRF